MISCCSFWPAKKFDRPMSFDNPKSLKIFGLRRSTPTRQTFSAPKDKTDARLMATKVLPSPPIEEVTAKTWPVPSFGFSAMNFKLDRSARKASLTEDFGLLNTTRLLSYFECGAIPAKGIFVTFSMSWRLRTFVFSAFISKIKPAGKINPINRPMR